MITKNLKDFRSAVPNSVRYGTQRDKAIIRAIEETEALDTEQIQHLFFPYPTGRRMAQKRLALMVTNKTLSKTRLALDSPNIYYLGRKNGKLQHLIGTNWAYVWFRNRLMSGQKLYYWKNEVDYTIVQCDALCGIKTPSGYLWYFVEYDRSSTSHNNFDKVKKYNEFYAKHSTMSLWWVEKADSFPKILVITETERKREQILEQVNDPSKNTYGLIFEVKLISDIKEESEHGRKRHTF